MPLFEYAPVLDTHEAPSACCSFEVLQKHSEAALTHCPTCNHPIKKVISAFSMNINSNKKSVTASQSSNTGLLESAPCASGHTAPSNTAAGRAIQNAMGHVCRAGCKH